MTRFIVSAFRFVFLIAAIALAFGMRGAWAATASGTSITNSMTINYQDASSNNYSTTSNTVTTVVSGAPSLTVTASAQNVTLGMVAIATFTLTNAGNGSGNFQVPSDATLGGTATATTLNGYVLNGALTGTCSAANPCTLDVLETQMAALGTTSVGGTVTVGVEYTIGATASIGQTVVTTLTANVLYPAGTVAQALSSNVAGSETDTIITDARLDIQASATQPGSSGANITWTITANNGGGVTAKPLISAKTLLGASTSGIPIFIPMPSFNGTYLTLQAQPAAPTLSGASGGAASAVYYNAAACSTHPTSGWSTTYNASAECLAAYVYNSGTAVLPSAPSGSSGAGSVTTPQITFSFTTNQPSGTGSTNANAVTLVASSAIGGNPWSTLATPIIGQGLAIGSATDLTTTSLNNIQTNTTPSSGTTPPGGSSNQAGSQAYVAVSATMTIADPSAQNVTPSITAIDTFTLTNTSSAAGTFALTGPATFGGTGAASLLGFVLAGATSGTCSTVSPCSYTTLNAQAGMAGIAVNGTQTVGVVYQVSSGATSGQTIQPSITANVTASGTTSSNVTNTAYSDSVLSADARLDIQTSVTNPSGSGGNITWTVKANNGGSQSAQGLASAKTALGLSYNGIVIFMPVPSFNGTYLTIQSAPATPTLNGAQGGDTPNAYYNSSACSTAPTSGWSTSAYSTAKCIAIYVQNSGSTILPSASSGSSGAGNVTTPQITFSFTTNQPSGTGSTNANAVTLIASGAIGGSNTGTPILGPGVPANTSDAATASLLNSVQTNVTPGSGANPPGGASNVIGSQAYSALALMTITDPAGQTVTPSMIVVDTFILTNTTGSGTGTFQVTSGATFTGTAPAPTLQGYVLAGAATGTCSVATPCTLTTLNGSGELGAGGVAAAGGTVTVGVEYKVSSSSTSAQTIQPSISATIAVSGDTTSSPTANATYADTVSPDARLDVQASATIPGSSGANITWTVTANNGGGQTAVGLSSAKTALASGGANYNGIAIFMPVPSFSGTSLVIQSAPSAPTLSGTVAGGTNTAVYYNTAACSTAPTSGWSTTAYSTAKCIAVYLYNGGSNILPSEPSGSSGAGSVSTPQITFTFVTNQPSGSGSSNANAVTLLATGVVGGLAWTTGTPIVGQGVTIGTLDASTASLVAGIETNTTSSSGTTAPGGGSNQAGSQAYASVTYSILVGPYGAATATGAWSASTVPGYTTGTANNSNDFSFFDYDHSATATNSSATVASGPSGNAIANGGVVYIVNTAQNAGSGTDSIVLSASTVSNWTVSFQCYNATANACGSGDAQYSCHASNLASNTISALASGATYNFCTTLTPSSTVTAFSPVAWTITGTSSGNGSVSNTTYDVLYPGGEIVTFRSYAVSGCPGGVTPANNGAISGCTITYTVTVVNEAPSASAGSGSGNATVTPSSSITMTENGSTNGNTWAANTNGLTGTPTLTSCTSCTTTGTTSSTSFTVTIPASDLAPQGSASFSYAVVVK